MFTFEYLFFSYLGYDYVSTKIGEKIKVKNLLLEFFNKIHENSIAIYQWTYEFYRI